MNEMSLGQTTTRGDRTLLVLFVFKVTDNLSEQGAIFVAQGLLRLSHSDEDGARLVGDGKVAKVCRLYK